MKADKLWEILKENTIVELKSKIPRENNSIGDICGQLCLKIKVKNDWFEQKYMNKYGEID